MEPRYQHTANVVDSVVDFRMLIMFGGTKKFLGDPVAETNLVHLGKWGTACLGIIPLRRMHKTSSYFLQHFKPEGSLSGNTRLDWFCKASLHAFKDCYYYFYMSIYV